MNSSPASKSCPSDCEKTIFLLKIGWYNFV
jgi:hypothetical protein